MKIAIGADHAGFECKQALVQLIQKLGHTVQDVGTGSNESCDYPLFAEKVALEVAAQRADRGILVCGNGMGMYIVANKIPGIRATLVMNEKMVVDTRSHHDANVLTLAGRDLPVELNLKLTELWLKTPFSNVERHARRIHEIMEIEKKYMKP